MGVAGTVSTAYDVTGNVTRLGVSRPSALCLPSTSPCTQEYAYDWDEVGRLVRARRWDVTTGVANVTGPIAAVPPEMDLRHRYDASDNRVIKRDYVASSAAQRHTLYVFGSFEVRRTTYNGTRYLVDQYTAVPYAMANGVRLARLHYSERTEPRVTGLTATEDGATGGDARLHVLIELGDHLGSTGTVLDKATGELVEKASYLAYGAKESDYRAERWEGFREDYGFTGKEEDVEVGLVYFGKRFLSPQLGRWVSPDPLAVHSPGEADLNLYAYVKGAVLKSVDPVGLVDEGMNYSPTEMRRVLQETSKIQGMQHLGGVKVRSKFGFDMESSNGRKVEVNYNNQKSSYTEVVGGKMKVSIGLDPFKQNPAKQALHVRAATFHEMVHVELLTGDEKNRFVAGLADFRSAHSEALSGFQEKIDFIVKWAQSDTNGRLDRREAAVERESLLTWLTTEAYVYSQEAKVKANGHALPEWRDVHSLSEHLTKDLKGKLKEYGGPGYTMSGQLEKEIQHFTSDFEKAIQGGKSTSEK